jgi:hypothetical protein
MDNPNSPSATDRRSFLKTGALLATPIAVMTPAVAMARDASGAELARLQDERAIEALHRAFLQRVNTRGAEGVGELLAADGSCDLDGCVRRIADDPAAEAALELAPDGRSAKARRPTHIESEVDFTGNSTLEQMARFQGQGTHRHSEARVLEVEYVKAKDDWAIASVKLA